MTATRPQPAWEKDLAQAGKFLGKSAVNTGRVLDWIARAEFQVITSFGSHRTPSPQADAVFAISVALLLWFLMSRLKRGRPAT